MLGVYVHVPYCVQRCPYCDFATQVVEDIPHRTYADAVIAELELRLVEADWSGRETASLYFGGGTPSLWEPRELGRVIEAVDRRLGLPAGAEVTVETNPGRAESGHLAELRAAGVNRISFGTQSFQQRFLEALGRWHSEADSFAAVESARRAGFDNVSVDLIYAVPGQTPEAAAEDVRRAAACEPDHVSTYCLTLERQVPMARAVATGTVRLPGEAQSVEIEDAVLAGLRAAGYRRYEISNHARPGREAVHNTLYWTGHEYLALGASANGFRREADGHGIRYGNHPNGRHYLELVRAGRLPTRQEERLDRETLLAERMFCGLRLADGLDPHEVSGWSGLPVAERFGSVLRRLVREGLVREEADGRLLPTELGLRFHNEVSLRFM